jgi:hypothetical protein
MSGISLYSKVQTPDGVGVVISLNCMKVNGLYYVPECAEATVWYGTDNAANGWVQRAYDLNDISLKD